MTDLKEIKSFVNNEYWNISSTDDNLDGFAIVVEFHRKILKEPALSQIQQERFKFKLLLEERYPFKDPQIQCLTNFLPGSNVSVSDGRDLFNEVVGLDGWKKDYPLYKLIWLLPDFVEDMYEFSLRKESLTHVTGTFHLGSLYDLREINQLAAMHSSYKTMYDVQEQSESDCQKFTNKVMCISGYTLLLFSKLPFNLERPDTQYFGILEAWASLRSILRLRKPDQTKLSIIFKPHDEKQPWVLNLICNQTDELVQILKSKLQVVQSTRTARSEIDDLESKLDELDRTGSDPAELMTIYQKVIEYHSSQGQNIKAQEYLKRLKQMLAEPLSQRIENEGENFRME